MSKIARPILNIGQPMSNMQWFHPEDRTAYLQHPPFHPKHPIFHPCLAIRQDQHANCLSNMKIAWLLALGLIWLQPTPRSGLRPLFRSHCLRPPSWPWCRPSWSPPTTLLTALIPLLVKNQTGEWVPDYAPTKRPSPPGSGH